MRDHTQFCINGEWVEPAVPTTLDVINPASAEVCGRISLGAAADVDRAVAATRSALTGFSQASRVERLALLERIVAEYKKRYDGMADAITEEMGAPSSLAQQA